MVTISGNFNNIKNLGLQQ